MTMTYTAYQDQLGACFSHYVELVAAKYNRKNSTVLAHLESIATGEEPESAAVRMGVSRQAVHQGRDRALAALVTEMGAKDRLDYPAIRTAILRYLTPETVSFLPHYTEKARPA